jgi:hypothetical protein
MRLLDKINTIPDPSKDGWRSAFQIRDEEAPNTAISTVRYMLREGVSKGVVEREKFICPVRKQTIWFYREFTGVKATTKKKK